MNSPNELNRDAQRLIAQSVEDDLTDAQFDALDRLLAETPGAPAAYAEYLQLHTDLYFLAHERRSSSACEKILVELAAESHAVSLSTRLASGVRQFVTQPTPLSLAVAMMVVGSIVTILALVTAPLYRASFKSLATAESETPVIVAEITAANAAEWAEGQIGGQRGDSLVAGHRLRLLAGVIEVTYRDGVTLAIEGPSEVILGNLGSVRLAAGRLVANVPKRAIGFQVETSAATITDLSTQFGVTVSEQGAVSVHVISGRVRTQPKVGAPRDAVELAAGQSLRFDGQWRLFATLPTERDKLQALLNVRPTALPLLCVDFQSTTDGRLQPGFSSFTELDAATGKTFETKEGPLHVTVAGQSTLKNGFFARNILFNSGRLTLAEVYDDFVFHNNGGALTLKIHGVKPHQEYDLLLYCWDHYDPGKLTPRHTNQFVAQAETSGRRASVTFDLKGQLVSNEQGTAHLRVRSTTDVLTIAIVPMHGLLTRLNGFELFAAPSSDQSTDPIIP